ncbi:glycosyltransferase family 2 protein [Flavobacterium jejuense]|uniref:Glycosyltransferase family 2 protein n=1 Tax=Flavobacterium jejuense TaxID=1544455 RepID=A0ABX0J007_9FLAO|nr:glycosyltransferase [Flavobacterium jejuense]NHN27566.1 glycosyltransferase family 2 protein [Flavobacterium jejuense]
MLSILVPTYNYNTYPLVLELKEQADLLSIDYEILVQDDFSSLFIEENSKINELENCSFEINKENLGRGKNINLLNSKAKYENVLIMEADSFPEKKEYLEILISNINQNTKIIFGGVIYPKKKPNKEKVLRWKYGTYRETKSLIERKKNPYSFVFSWNLLLKKEIISNNPFKTSIKHYGYEDLIFINDLRRSNTEILHIENHLIHYNFESNLTFIKKTETAITMLNQLITNGELNYIDTKITKAYRSLKFFHLETIFIFLFKKISNSLVTNLNSLNPNLIQFDLYKLGYFCLLNKKKNV